MTVVSATDLLFGNVAQQTNPTFMADVVTLINESPNLVAEINTLDNTPDQDGGQATINLQSDSGEGGDTYYHADYINESTLVSYDDSTTPYAGGSFTNAFDSVTSASVFVGILAHEIGHWLDVNLAPIYLQGDLAHYSLQQAVATEFSSEGKAAFSQYTAKAQIDAANGGAGIGYFGDANSLAQDSDQLRLVSKISDIGQAESYLGSQFWNVNVNGGTYLSNFWTSYGNGGAINYLNISESAITNVTVQLNDSGSLIGSTIQTASLNYAFAYSGVGNETASVSDASGNLLYTTVFTDPGTSSFYSLALYATGGDITQASYANETVIGNNNIATDSGSGTVFNLNGDNNYLFSVAASATDSVTGDNNTVYSFEAAGTVLNLTLSGLGDVVVLGSGATNIYGDSSSSEIFGGSGALTYNGDGGIIVLSGAATIVGSAAHTEVWGGAGTVQYIGESGYDDVIMSTGSATIHAGGGGGWYEGGTNGHNFIQGSDSGLGTILAAGGNGDTITGGSHGGDYFLAGAGNETLNGGNSFGTQVMFLGSGFASVTTGTASSIIDTGSGSALINGAGSTMVYGGSGQSDTYTAEAGSLGVVGFRVGVDHVGGSINSVAFQGNNTTLQLSDGASVTLFGVQTHAYG